MRTFAAVDDELGIVGFYGLSSFTLTMDEVPEALSRKLPHYGLIPAALIGRLARDLRGRGRGIGELLLADAVQRIMGACKTLAVFAIVVDAVDDQATAFYQAFGFVPFPAAPRRLFLPTSTAVGALDLAVKKPNR